MEHSRRSFLIRSLSLPALAKPAFAAGLLNAAIDPNTDRPLFPFPQIIRYDSKCFTVHGKDVFLYGAEFHYPRCAPALWQDRFLKIKQAGFNTVETMVFWNYHERREGNFDFSELEAFLALARQMGLWVIVRPGPYICAEFERAGFPQYIIARQFPLRGMHPDNLKASQYWYGHALPIIRRHQVTRGGPIILMQLENEYDYWELSGPEKAEYIRTLARLAWDAGIDVPLFTNWTKVVRNPADPDLSRIFDTCDFYPRWNFVEQITPPLAKLRVEQRQAPLGITELQGGWFSQTGGLLSIDQEGVSAQQIAALTRTSLSLGVNYFNYYMGYGGTNFDWAAKTLTTTYDYAAPIREHGGLGEKYYAVKSIGSLLDSFGPLLARAEEAPNSVTASNPNVATALRSHGDSGLLFVRADGGGQHHTTLTVKMPGETDGMPTRIPHSGQMVLGAREMKALPLNCELPGATLVYSTAELQMKGRCGQRSFAVFSDQTERIVEIALAGQGWNAEVAGAAYWQPGGDGSPAIGGFRVGAEARTCLLRHDFAVIVVPHDLGARSWLTQAPAGAGDASHAAESRTPWITDAYLLESSHAEGNRLEASIQYLPGEHHLTILLPAKPVGCRVDGNPAPVRYDAASQTARASFTVPPLPLPRLNLTQFRYSVETLQNSSASGYSGSLLALEKIGPVPYGYVKYAARISYQGEPSLYIASFADDEKKVFINGAPVPQASNKQTWLQLNAAGFLKPGQNQIEISYELFGKPNGGGNLGELSGIQSLRLGSDPESARAIEDWKIQLSAPCLNGRQISDQLDTAQWPQARLNARSPAATLKPAYTWLETSFALPSIPQGWHVPWKASIDASADALLYLNRKFVGRFSTRGPQVDFYLPEPYLEFGGKANRLVVLLAYTDQPASLRSLVVHPYVDAVAKSTQVAWEL